MEHVHDDEEIAILLLLMRGRWERSRFRQIWTREHFLLRTERGEWHRTFLYLKENRDDELFWNYMRMSNTTFDALKDMVAQELESTQNNFRRDITHALRMEDFPTKLLSPTQKCSFGDVHVLVINWISILNDHVNVLVEHACSMLDARWSSMYRVKSK